MENPPDNSKRQKDWHENHQLLGEHYVQFIKENKKPPTLKQLILSTGLSKNCVHTHLQHLDKTSLAKTFAYKRVLTPYIVDSLANRAMGKGSGANVASKLWLQVMEGLTDNVNVSGNVTYEKMTDEELLLRKQKNDSILLMDETDTLFNDLTESEEKTDTD